MIRIYLVSRRSAYIDKLRRVIHDHQIRIGVWLKIVTLEQEQAACPKTCSKIGAVCMDP